MFTLRHIIFLPFVEDLACATDESKLWLSLSARQHQNHFSGLPTVYPNFSIHHDWQKSHCLFDLPIKWFIESVGGPEQGYWCCFSHVTNQDEVTSTMQASRPYEKNHCQLFLLFIWIFIFTWQWSTFLHICFIICTVHISKKFAFVTCEPGVEKWDIQFFQGCLLNIWERV